MKRLSFSRLLDRLAPKEGLVLSCMAIGVGAATGLAAVVFIRLIESIHRICFSVLPQFLPEIGRVWLLVIPVLGAAVAGPLIAWFATEAKGHGVPEVMQALILRGGRIRPRVAIAKIVASALCIGTGGSAGREGPIVQVGSTLGSIVGQWLKLSDDRIKNLVACGAAAGIAATFNAPIAGITFAIEVLLSELQVVVFGNVVIAAVSASIVSRVFLGARPAFLMPAYVLHSSWEILLYVILGLLAALIGIFFISLLDRLEIIFDRMAVPQAVKPMIGVFLLGLLGLVYPYVALLFSVSSEEARLGATLADNIPHVYGAGFDFIESVLRGEAPFVLLLLLVFLKPLATSLTLGAGNSGGVFAPSLFTGAMLGGAFGHLLKILMPDSPVEIGAYALVGMAAVFAAAARAPLTAMLIVFEMSNDYQLILPLMAAGMTASSVAQWLHPDSIYTIKLSRRGIRFEQGRDLDIMQGVSVAEVMNTDPVTIHRDQSLSELFALFQETHLQGFPVMGEGGRLYGVVTLQDMERTIDNMERTLERQDVNLADVKVWDVATASPLTVFADEPIYAAIRKMAPRDLARLPVVSREDESRMVGQISRSDILRAYQVGIVHKQQNELVRERMHLRRVGEVEFIEVTIDNSDGCVGKTLADITLPKNTTVVSVERQDEVEVPNGQTVFCAGDRVTILCRREFSEKVRAIFGGETPP